MYSLVSAPVLGFDLSRLPGGSATADVLLRSLSLTESDLEVIANFRMEDWDRLTLWQDVDEAARQRQTIRDLSVEPSDAHQTLALLEQAPIGTVDGLLQCLRQDVLDWTWTSTGGSPAAQSVVAAQATSVICDAVVAAYLRDLLSVPSRRTLAAGWLSATRWLPVRPVHLGPQHDDISALLSRVRVLSPAQLARLAAAADATRRGASGWAPAVHAASWAVYVSGRVRAAAAAQLMLVRAVDDAGIPLADRAGGTWNLLSGAVQAMAARDLLAVETHGRLVDPLLAALDPPETPGGAGA
ncbi:hypothetical protein HC028_18030 [Planosporangium flavigriseum]|uniref:Uncharacterized protein n=1 Tax=Planosporangium flavigriseum TaxID=373681 RepID=A0A8J3LMT7_9ACTN|nr:hypothetical protein [Planosporangium flavigriseum]NJC66390.1 hypothetical protein [Planosporangium flavigriseum]GIG74204.1 hypothetical protein Pfl04_26080 [Planosporangium flavigriseum]